MPFSLSGAGVHAITPGTGWLEVHVTTFPALPGVGRANPANYYELGLLRVGDGTGFWPAQPIEAEHQVVGCPSGTTQLGYALFAGTIIEVTDVAGSNPFSGPVGSTGATGATGAAGPT